MVRVVLISATGLLGSKLFSLLSSRGFDVVGTSSGDGRFISFDLSEPDVGRLRSLKPDVVVISGAYTDVDGCEVDRMSCFKVNCYGVQAVASNVDAHLIYVSTDYVFSGERSFWVERDGPRPLQWYGVTKLCGEHAVMAYARRWTVLRPSTLFGYGGRKVNFGMFVARELTAGRVVKAFVDLYSTPTLADNLAEAVAEVVEREITGLFHFSGTARASRYQWALEVARRLGREELVVPAVSSEARWVAKRPKDSSLGSLHVDVVFKTRRLDLSEAVEKFVSEFRRYEGGG